MHRADFVAADGQSWWLCETQIDSRAEEARRELGTALGFTENEWFADPNRRTLLFDLLESRGSVLLNDLDYLTDDAKLGWLREATRLAVPPSAAQDDRTDAAQPAQADIQPVAPPPAPAKKSIFKSKVAADTTDPAQADIPPVAPPPAPAKKSIFKSKAAADTTAPAHPADEGANDPATTNGDGDSDPNGRAEVPQLDQTVQTVLADVTGGGLAGLAQDLGVEADELETIVNHPDFEREVREEVARITGA